MLLRAFQGIAHGVLSMGEGGWAIHCGLNIEIGSSGKSTIMAGKICTEKYKI